MKLQELLRIQRRDTVSGAPLFVREGADGRGLSFVAGLIVFLLLFVQQTSSADPIGDVLKTAAERYTNPDLTESERREVSRALYMELTEAVEAAGESSPGYERAISQMAFFAVMGGLYEEAAIRYDDVFALGIDKESPPLIEGHLLNSSVAYLGASRLEEATSTWKRFWENAVSDDTLTKSERRGGVTFSRRWLEVGSEMGQPLEVFLGPLADFWSSQDMWSDFDVDREGYVVPAYDRVLLTLEEVISDGRGYLLPGLIEDATELRQFFALRESWQPKVTDDLERICSFRWPPESVRRFGMLYPPLTRQNIRNLVTAESPEDYCRKTASQLREMMGELAFPPVAMVRVLKLAAQVVRIGLLSPEESAEFAEELMVYRIQQGTVSDIAERESSELMLEIESALRQNAAVLESAADRIRKQESGESL